MEAKCKGTGWILEFETAEELLEFISCEGPVAIGGKEKYWLDIIDVGY
jgi:hypothetical protein